MGTEGCEWSGVGVCGGGLGVGGCGVGVGWGTLTAGHYAS